MEYGDIPTFKIYSILDNIYYDAVTSEPLENIIWHISSDMIRMSYI